MDVGEECIVFGANTGSLYFFNRAGQRFLQLVSSPEIRAAVTHIRFSPDERFVALSTLDGELVVLEPKLGTRAKERIVLRHHLHRDATTATDAAATASSSASLTPSASPATTPSTSSTAATAAATAAAGASEGPVTCLTWAPRGQDDENYLFSTVPNADISNIVFRDGHSHDQNAHGSCEGQRRDQLQLLRQSLSRQQTHQSKPIHLLCDILFVV
jgi:WD40 repeat protein